MNRRYIKIQNLKLLTARAQGKHVMSEKTAEKKTSKKKYVKEVARELDELNKKKNQFLSSQNTTSSKVEQIRFTVELIKYLTAELENAKAELALLKEKSKESEPKNKISLMILFNSE